MAGAINCEKMERQNDKPAKNRSLQKITNFHYNLLKEFNCEENTVL